MTTVVYDYTPTSLEIEYRNPKVKMLYVIYLKENDGTYNSFINFIHTHSMEEQQNALRQQSSNPVP